MMEFNKPFSELIQIRKSHRTFIKKDLPPRIQEKINQLLAENNTGPFGNLLKFNLIQKEFSENGQKVKIGTYGFISGAKYFIVGEVENKPYGFEDYGFALEKIILLLTSMELGTCWLGGTFNRKMLYGLMQSGDDIIIPAITPVGFVARSKTIRERIIRRVANANQRLTWDLLFFNHDFYTPLTENDASRYALPLEMVRLAPSASNKQPWRILKKNNAFHFFLKRTPGYRNAFKVVDLQRVDIGIAMAHFELVCQDSGLNGKWENLKSEWENFENPEYIISWKTQNML
ncbi:MAG: nitroreductase family protein [Bacteroidales bacterium]